MILYTIGHSNHPIDQFIQLLLDHKIECLVDVRTTPYSRFNPQFNQAGLGQALLNQGIEYIYIGTELGGRPRDPSCYKHHIIPAKASDFLHEVDYLEVMRRPWFIQGIQQLLDLASNSSTVIMCSEGDPALCHRHHLIARCLLANQPDVTILHILKDGNLLDSRSIAGVTNKSDGEQLSF